MTWTCCCYTSKAAAHKKITGHVFLWLCAIMSFRDYFFSKRSLLLSSSSKKPCWPMYLANIWKSAWNDCSSMFYCISGKVRYSQSTCYIISENSLVPRPLPVFQWCIPRMHQFKGCSWQWSPLIKKWLLAQYGWFLSWTVTFWSCKTVSLYFHRRTCKYMYQHRIHVHGLTSLTVIHPPRETAPIVIIWMGRDCC